MPTADALRACLDRALAALAEGRTAEAEHCAKAVSAVARAELELAALLASAVGEAEKDEHELRAELLGRIRRLVDAEAAGAPDELLEQIGRGASVR